MAAIDLRSDQGGKSRIAGGTFVDATGRSAALSKGDIRAKRPRLVAFKAHLSNVRAEPGVCEIYFFNGGYGGLSHVEGDKANFCFILRADVARKFIGQTNQLFRSILTDNPRASERMSDAGPLHDWLAVAVDRFGSRALHQSENVLAVGDAGAFIDPFTGSGMLMAFEGSELLASFFGDNGFAKAAYCRASRRLFRKRLAISAMLRRAAFIPGLASGAILLTGAHDGLRSALAKATRSRSQAR